MTRDEERELRQLLWVAEQKLEAVKDRVKAAQPKEKAEMSQPMTAFASLFSAKNSTLGPEQRWGVLLGADLADVAVRLVTIEERLRSAGYLTPYGAFQDLVREVTGDRQVLQAAFRNQLDDILHVLLRDNIGHIEPTSARGKEYWHARQDVLNTLTLEAIATMIGAILEKVKQRLKTAGLVI